jgi:hypothetical protein
MDGGYEGCVIDAARAREHAGDGGTSMTTRPLSVSKLAVPAVYGLLAGFGTPRAPGSGQDQFDRVAQA